MDDAELLHSQIIDRVGAREGLRPEKALPLEAVGTGAVVGEVQELSGMNLDKAVVTELRIDDGEQPSWTRTFHVFAPSRSLVPHLAVEWAGSVDDGVERVRLLVDLLPRIDLAVNLDYVDEIYQPLSRLHRDAADIPDIVIVRVPPRRAVAMSPWRLAASVPAGSVGEFRTIVDGYLDHWMAINTGGVGSPVDPLASDQARLVQHDRFHRNALFDADSDPYWERVDRWLGIDAAAELRTTLRSQRDR